MITNIVPSKEQLLVLVLERPTLKTTNLALQLHWPQHSLSLNQANFGTPPMQLMVPRRRQLVICSSFKLNTIKNALRVVQRLHRNLGHPSPEALADLLLARGAHASVVSAAKEYKCVACLKHKKPNQVAPSSMPQPKSFNDTIQADVFYLKPGDRKFSILSIVDVGAKFMAASLVLEETSESYSKALEKVWLRHFGPPRVLVTDEGRPWLGGTFETWTSAVGIDHQVAPGEAHERLALVERRHAVLRRACEVYLSDRKLTDAHGVKEALTYVIPQQNATPSVAGFTPSQWVLGYQPELSHLLDSNLNAAHLAGNNITFEQNLERRTSARMALTSADADSKLRRALSRKYQGQSRIFRLGERVWFWRDARQSALNKIRWLGPAHVALREEDPDAPTEATKVNTYWLAYKSQLIRAAPHHVRGDILGPQHVFWTTCKHRSTCGASTQVSWCHSILRPPTCQPTTT